MLYFTNEVFRLLANQIHGHIRVMLDYHTCHHALDSNLWSQKREI